MSYAEEEKRKSDLMYTIHKNDKEISQLASQLPEHRAMHRDDRADRIQARINLLSDQSAAAQAELNKFPAPYVDVGANDEEEEGQTHVPRNMGGYKKSRKSRKSKKSKKSKKSRKSRKSRKSKKSSK